MMKRSAIKIRVRFWQQTLLLLISVAFASTDCVADSNSERAEAMQAIKFPVESDIALDTKQQEQKILSMLAAKDYEGLDKLAESLQSSKSEYANGLWKLDYFFDSFHFNKLARDLSDEQLTGKIDQVFDWIAAKPTSLTARLAYATLQIQYAWKARGGGFSNTVSRQGWTLMEEREEKALKALKDARTLSKSSPYWYFLMLYIAKDRSFPSDYKDMLVNELREKYPGYKRAFLMRCLDLDERWGGSKGELERYTAKEADRIGGGSGDVFYAQIAWGLDDRFWYRDQDFFPKLNFSWTRIKRGMQAIQVKFPKSQAVISEYCRLAAMAGDFQSARPLFAKLRGCIDKRIWHSAQSFTTLRDLAFTEK